MRMRRKKNLEKRLTECGNIFEIYTEDRNFNEAVKEKEYFDFEKIFGGQEIGIICENSENGLYEAIKSVLDKPELLQKYRQNTLLRAEDFSYESRARIIEEFYGRCGG